MTPPTHLFDDVILERSLRVIIKLLQKKKIQMLCNSIRFIKSQFYGIVIQYKAVGEEGYQNSESKESTKVTFKIIASLC